jgi:hypothetical protein
MSGRDDTRRKAGVEVKQVLVVDPVSSTIHGLHGVSSS